MQTKKLVVGIDGNEANVREKVGVHQYAFELLHSLYRIQDQWSDNFKFTIFLKDNPPDDFPIANNNWSYKVLPSNGMWVIKTLTPYLLFHKDINLFFSPSHYLPPIFYCPLVCTIHDLGYLKFSEQFRQSDIWQLKIWSAISVFMAKRVIAVSSSVKKDIKKYYHKSDNNIKVIYHGLDKSKFNINISEKSIKKSLANYKLPKNYILYIGTLKPSKNIDSIIRAFKLICDNYQDLVLVIAGKKGWFYDSIYHLVEDMGLGQRVIFTGYVDETDKPAILAGSRMLVSPSYWEGFGMHVLEAMACGTPVVISNIASLPEVAGKSAIYVDPNDVDSIAKGIKEVLNMSKTKRLVTVKSGMKNIQRFDWQKNAQNTVNIFKEVCNDVY